MHNALRLLVVVVVARQPYIFSFSFIRFISSSFFLGTLLVVRRVDLDACSHYNSRTHTNTHTITSANILSFRLLFYLILSFTIAQHSSALFLHSAFTFDSLFAYICLSVSVCVCVSLLLVCKLHLGLNSHQFSLVSVCVCVWAGKTFCVCEMDLSCNFDSLWQGEKEFFSFHRNCCCCIVSFLHSCSPHCLGSAYLRDFPIEFAFLLYIIFSVAFLP